MRRHFLVVMLSFLVLTACANEFTVVQIPLRNADLYPRSLAKGGVTVAVDAITDNERVMAYFGVDLLKAKILPVNIIFSNHGNGRYIIKPSDILLLRGNEVMDPMPFETVVEVAKDLHAGISAKTARQVSAYFSNLALQDTMLAPQQTHQGVMFFKIKETEEEAGDFLIRKLFREGSMKINIGVTDAATGERVQFALFL